MRSKHTGQVGSSIREGVGGGAGLVERVVDLAVSPFAGVGEDGVREGVNGSCRMSGKESTFVCGRPENVMLLMKTTWRFSGC